MTSPETQYWTMKNDSLLNETLTALLTNESPGTGSKDHHEIHLYIVLGMLAVLSVTGTLGNALVLIVYMKKRDKLTANLFILALAAIDFSTCVAIIPATMYMEFVKFFTPSEVFCKLYQFIVTSTIPLSAFVMAAIAFDRYFCICHPFLHAITIFRAKIILVCLGILASLLGAVVALIYGIYRIKEVIIPLGNDTAIQANTTLPTYVNGTTPVLDISNHTSELLNRTEYRLVYHGKCDPDMRIIGLSGMSLYQKIHAATFVTCLIAVLILYAIIYYSVVLRRIRRERQKSSYSKKNITVNSAIVPDEQTEEVSLTYKNGNTHEKNGTNHEDYSTTETSSISKNELPRMKSAKKKNTRDKLYMANIKTAGMLFVVTIVFAITFLPACLMANGILAYNGPVFYSYFFNNIANPLIYGFMNKNFRDDLKKLFSCR